MLVAAETNDTINNNILYLVFCWYIWYCTCTRRKYCFYAGILYNWPLIKDTIQYTMKNIKDKCIVLHIWYPTSICEVARIKCGIANICFGDKSAFEFWGVCVRRVTLSRTVCLSLFQAKPYYQKVRIDPGAILYFGETA